MFVFQGFILITIIIWELTRNFIGFSFCLFWCLWNLSVLFEKWSPNRTYCWFYLLNFLIHYLFHYSFLVSIPICKFVRASKFFFYHIFWYFFFFFFSIFFFFFFLFVIAALFDLAILGSLFSLKVYYLSSWRIHLSRSFLSLSGNLCATPMMAFVASPNSLKRIFIHGGVRVLSVLQHSKIFIKANVPSLSEMDPL